MTSQDGAVSIDKIRERDAKFIPYQSTNTVAHYDRRTLLAEVDRLRLALEKAQKALDSAGIAEAVAARIFEIGREYSTDPHRIEYKVIYQGREVGVGGLAREPFTRYVREGINNYRAAIAAGEEK